jgi:sec-independent protein translocase protein TatA
MLHSMNQILAISWPGPFEMMLLAGLGLLIFGKRLPEVGKNIGRGIVEFKKGLKEAEQEITAEPTTAPPTNTQQALAPKYKFDPYTGKPIDENTPASS